MAKYYDRAHVMVADLPPAPWADRFAGDRALAIPMLAPRMDMACSSQPFRIITQTVSASGLIFKARQAAAFSSADGSNEGLLS